MSRHTCWKCGCGYDGINCPVCAVNDQAEESARQATRDQEEATAAMEAAIAEQTAQFAEEMERTREAAEAAAFETQMAIAEAAESQQRALAKAAEEHKRTTANAWKLQAQAKSDQAYRLYQSGLISEALDLALQAVKEDPAGIDGIFVAGACLEAQGKVEEAHAYLAKQVQMLTLPDYQMQVKIHTQVLHAVDSDPALIKTFCHILRNNVPLWPTCERIETAESLIDALLAIKEYQLAAATQRWIIESRGLTLETLASTRRLFTRIANSPNGVESSRSEIEKILQWLESPANRVTEYATRSKTGRTALFTIAASLELSPYIHFQSELLPNYFKELPFDKRADFEVEVSALRQQAECGQVEPKAYARILDTAKQKYTSWIPDIEQQVRTNGATQIKNLAKEGSGCLWTILWMFILAGIQVAFFAVKRPNMSSLGPYQAVLAFGLVLGAVLLASLSIHVIRAFKRSQKAHELMANISTQQNAALERLGLPQISIQKPALRSPVIDLMICGSVVVAFLLGWQAVVSKAAGYSLPNAAPDSGSALYNGSGVEDELKGQSAGQAFGVGWTDAIGARGATFHASDSSGSSIPPRFQRKGLSSSGSRWTRVTSMPTAYSSPI